MSKLIALIEVLLVRVIIMGSVILVARTPFLDWQIETFQQVFSSHLIFIFVTVTWLLVSRRNFGDYGIIFHQLGKDFRTAMGVYLPVALSGVALGYVSYTSWDGALIMALVQLGVLFWVALTMSNVPDPKSGLVTVFLSVVLFGLYGYLQSTLPLFSSAILRFIFFLIFVGFGEEILYRGYILTRLNKAFGCPNQFFGVSWGWGAVISAVLFGLSHVLNGWNILTGEFTPFWWWGLWTFIGAFVFTYIREKSGSIVPGAIVHGLPQALLALFISSF